MRKLPLTEDIDFAYLLELMPPLHDIPEFSWLPELFSVIGYESLILLCRYAGGETIKIPTIEQLTSSIDALQWFYDIFIKHTKLLEEVPENLNSQVLKISEIYNVRNGEDSN